MSEDDVKWIVNSLGELGVEIEGRCFFLYKGRSLEYGIPGETKDGICLHADGTPMSYRIVGKREFGETCHPITCMAVKDDQICDRTPFPYTQTLPYLRGMSFSRSEDGDWRPLIGPNIENGSKKVKINNHVVGSLPFIAVGQECLCPDGYGRVTEWSTSSLKVTTVRVFTHGNNRGCTWDSNSVVLIPPFGSDRPLIRADQLLDADRLRHVDKQTPEVGSR